MSVEYELLEIIENQKEIIDKQQAIIAQLLNENVEQECLINEMMSDRIDDFEV